MICELLSQQSIKEQHARQLKISNSSYFPSKGRCARYTLAFLATDVAADYRFLFFFGTSPVWGSLLYLLEGCHNSFAIGI